MITVFKYQYFDRNQHEYEVDRLLREGMKIEQIKPYQSLEDYLNEINSTHKIIAVAIRHQVIYEIIAEEK